jgi:hypothetical protein
MREPKNLPEWLESQGNPKHSIAEGENGSKAIAVENKSSLTPGITVYNFRETDLPNGGKTFWIGSGWGIRKEYLPAIKGLLNELEKEELPKDEFITFDEALAKRNEAQTRRRSFKVNDETPIGILSAEYDWGFWDAVVTIMKNCDMKELDVKAVQ